MSEWELSTVNLTPGIFGYFIEETPMIVHLGFLSWAGQIFPRRNLSSCHMENISLAPSSALGSKWEKGLEISIFTVTVYLVPLYLTLLCCVPGDPLFRYCVLSIPVNKCLIFHQGGQGQLHSYVEREKGSRTL